MRSTLTGAGGGNHYLTEQFHHRGNLPRYLHE